MRLSNYYVYENRIVRRRKPQHDTIIYIVIVVMVVLTFWITD